MPLGNDIVDLADFEALAVHPRFDRRVFTRDEILWLEAGDPLRRRWVLWGLKEAAIKCWRQMEPGLPFVPARIRVVPRGPDRATLHLDGRRAEGWWSEGFDHVTALAAVDPAQLSSACVGILRFPSARPLREVRTPLRSAALATVVSILGLGTDCDVALRFRCNAPWIDHKGRRLPVDLSFSHHGRFAAFAAARSAAASPGMALPDGA